MNISNSPLRDKPSMTHLTPCTNLWGEHYEPQLMDGDLGADSTVGAQALSPHFRIPFFHLCLPQQVRILLPQSTETIPPAWEAEVPSYGGENTLQDLAPKGLAQSACTAL